MAAEFFSIEVEQMLLGEILFKNEVYGWVSDFLQPHHFFDPFHGDVYQEIGRIINEGRLAEPEVMKHMVAHIKQLRPDYLQALASGHMDTANSVDFARTIVDYYRLRMIGSVTADAQKTLQTLSPMDGGSLIESIEGQLSELAIETAPRKRRAQKLGAFLHTAIANSIDNKNRGTGLIGVTTGLVGLDRIVPGFEAGKYYVCGGRPGMGKSTIGLTFARAVALAGGASHVAANEMDGPEIANRMMSDEILHAGHKIPYKDIARGNLEPSEWALVEQARENLSDLAIIVDPESQQSISHIRSAAQASQRHFEKRGRKLELLVIDHLQNTKSTRNYQKRFEEVTQVSSEAAALAKDLDVAVLMMSQLSRNVETRDDKRPMLADLRESGGIEQDADVVMFLYRPAYYVGQREPEKTGRPADDEKYADWVSEMERVRNRTDLIVAKQRGGEIGQIRLWDEVKCCAFRDADPGGALL